MSLTTRGTVASQMMKWDTGTLAWVPWDGSVTGATGGGGGGADVQYVEDAVAVANPTGNALAMVRADTLAALTSADGDIVAARGTNLGELYTYDINTTSVMQGVQADTGDIANNTQGTKTILLDARKAVDDPSSPIDVGLTTLVQRHDTPANVSGSDGDYESLQMANGRLWTSTLVTGTVPLPTGAATSALQTTGNTSLASIDTKLTSPLTTIPSPITASGTISASAQTVVIALGKKMGTVLINTNLADVSSLAGTLTYQGSTNGTTWYPWPVKQASFEVGPGSGDPQYVVSSSTYPDQQGIYIAQVTGLHSFRVLSSAWSGAVATIGFDALPLTLPPAYTTLGGLGTTATLNPVKVNGTNGAMRVTLWPDTNAGLSPDNAGLHTRIFDTTGNTAAEVKLASTNAVAADPALVTRTVQLPTALGAGGGLKVDGSGTALPVSGTVAVTSAGLTNLDVALSTRTKPADQQHTIIDSGTTVVTQATGTNLHVVVDSAPTTAVTGPLTDTQLRASTVPVSGAAGGAVVCSLSSTAIVGLADNAGNQAKVKPASTLPVLSDTALVTTQRDPLPAGTNVIGHVITDTGSTTAVTGSVAVTGPLTDTQIRATALPVSGTVTTSPPANASTNVAQLAGTATSVNSGVKDAGTLRVVLATDQPALTNKLLVTPDSVALPANQSVNVNQFGGTGVTIGQQLAAASLPVILPAATVTTLTPPAAITGFALDATLTGRTQKTQLTDGTRDGTVKAASTLPIATDTAVVTTQRDALPAGTNVIGALTANQSVNFTQVNGVTISTGNGVPDTGTQRTFSAQRRTYSASLLLKTATAAGTAPFFSIAGSGTQTIRVQKILLSGTVGTAAIYGDVVLKKTSTATSGGTATALTKAPHDSNSAAATATVNFYTVLATAGTSVGVVQAQSAVFPITGTVAAAMAQLSFLDMNRDPVEAIVLRGTTQCLEMSFGTTPTNAPTLLISVTWTEE